MPNAIKLATCWLLLTGVALAQNNGATLKSGATLNSGATLTSKIISNATATFASSVALTLYTITGQVSVVETVAQNTGGLNTPTGSCGTFSLIASTTTSDSQGFWTTTATSTGSCTITTAYTPGTSVAMISFGFTLPSTYSSTVDGSPSSSNFASGFHSSNFSGSSITSTVNNDLYLCFGTSNSQTGIVVNNTNANFGTDFSAVSGGLWLTMGHYVQPSSGALACSYTVLGGGTTYQTAVMPMEFK